MEECVVLVDGDDVTVMAPEDSDLEQIAIAVLSCAINRGASLRRILESIVRPHTSETCEQPIVIQ